MEETYLCFEAESSLFLLPLNLVYHIVSGRCDEEGIIEFEDEKAEVFDIYGLLTGVRGREREYAVLMNDKGRCFGLMADSVAGIFTVSDAMCFAVPEEALGAENRFLKNAVYIESLKSWAFLVDLEWSVERER